MEDKKLEIGDSFYQVFDQLDTVSKLTVTEIVDSLYDDKVYHHYKCFKEDDKTYETIQDMIFPLRLEGGYYFFNYEDAVAVYNGKIDGKINKLQKKIDKLEAKKFKI